MLDVQLTNEATGFGLGFGVNRYRGHKTAQHMGAVYGFTTSIVVLPEQRIGVVVLSNADIGVAPVRRLSEAALDLLLEVELGMAPPAKRDTLELSTDELAAFAGDYESQSYWATLTVEDGALACVLSGQKLELTPVAQTTFLADGRIMSQSEFVFEHGDDGKVTGFRAAGQSFRRVAPDQEAHRAKRLAAISGKLRTALHPADPLGAARPFVRVGRERV